MFFTSLSLFNDYSGQFKTKQVNVTGDISMKNNPGKVTFVPGGQTVEVRAWSEKNAINKKKTVCWLGPKQGRGFIDGSPGDYIVNHLYTTKLYKPDK